MISERSGVSPAEIAQATRISAATVYSTLAKMTAAGEVAKENLPSGGVGYRIPEPQPDAA